MAPDLLLATNTPALAALQRMTESVPIVFVQVTDPIGDGFVASFARPGGRITGLTNFEPTMGGKWLEILKEIAPGVVELELLFNPQTSPGGGSFYSRQIEAAAATFAMQPIPMPLRNASEIEPAVAEFARNSNSGLVICLDSFMNVHRKLIMGLAARHRLPAIYPFRYFAAEGGLVSYGVDRDDLYRRVAAYVDRILRGAKPADLPVEAADEIRTCDQPQDREGARPRRAAIAARPRRRGDRMKTARVHHASRRRGGGWPLAARAQQPERMRRVGVLMYTTPDEPESQARIAALAQGLAGSGLGRRAQRADRHPLERGRCRAPAQGRGGTGRARLGCARGRCRPDHGDAATGDPHRADRVCPGPRSSRQRLYQEPSAAGRQYDRLQPVRIRLEREVAWIAQGDRAASLARGCRSRSSGRSRWGWTMGRDPGLCVADGRGAEPDPCARHGRRNRTRRGRLCGRSERRPDRGGGHASRRFNAI